jgi:hypothetical protein
MPPASMATDVSKTALFIFIMTSVRLGDEQKP